MGRRMRKRYRLPIRIGDMGYNIRIACYVTIIGDVIVAVRPWALNGCGAAF